jgi:uncharacterized protein YdhG (YjbR/CyaY superfamily)
MAKPKPTTIDEYIEAAPAGAQPVLRAVREAVHQAVPDVEEGIGYQMPVYKSHGRLFYFAAFRRHYSLFAPDPGTLFAAFAEELSPFAIEKSTVKFPADRPVPVPLIRAMAKHRAAENLRREARQPQARRR